MRKFLEVIFFVLIFAGTTTNAQDKLRLNKRTEEYGVITVTLSDGAIYSRDFDPDSPPEHDEAAAARSWKIGDAMDVDTDTEHNGCGLFNKLTDSDQKPPTYACFPKK